MNKQLIFSKVANGELTIDSAMELLSEPHGHEPDADVSVVDTNRLNGFVLNYFTGKLASALSVPKSEIDVDAKLMDLGIDSATLLAMSEEFEQELQITLYPTVFFEHPTLTEVADHFATEHPEAFVRLDPSLADSGTPHRESARPTMAESQDNDLIPTSHDEKASETVGLDTSVQSSVDPDRLSSFVLDYFTGKLASALSVPKSEIDVDANLMDLGIDSATLLAMSEEFEQDLQITLYPTVFFEYTTLTEVADHFATEHPEAFVRLDASLAGTAAPANIDAQGVEKVTPSDHPGRSEDLPSDDQISADRDDSTALQPLPAFIQGYFIAKVGKALSVPTTEIDADQNLMDLGLDSAALMQISDEVEAELQHALNPATFFEVRNLRELAELLAKSEGPAFERLRNAAQQDIAQTSASRDLHDGSTSFFAYELRDAPDADEVLGIELAIGCESTGFALAKKAVPDADHCLLSDESSIASALSKTSRSSVCLVIHADDFTIDALFELTSRLTSGISRVVSALGPKEPWRLVTIVAGRSTTASLVHGALSGFSKSILHEYPNSAVTLALTDPTDAGVQEVLSRCEHEQGRIRVLSLKDGMWKLEGPAPVRVVPGPRPAFRQGCRVLITGGAGQLGLIFARHLLDTAGAKVLLSGRSATSQDLQDELTRLKSAHGAEVAYLKCDVTDEKDVARLVERAREQLGGLDIVIHAAGVVKDQLLAKKPDAERDTVLGPKVAGTFLLDQATRSLPLDAFICFSSVAGFTGNKGQSDYATANAFMDRFIDYRETLRARGFRSGRSISVNWPLWEDGGMQPPPIVRDLIEKHVGMKSLKTQSGLDAFDVILRGDRNHVAVFSGDRDRIAGVMARSWPESVRTSSDGKMPIEPGREPAQPIAPEHPVTEALGDAEVTAPSAERERQSEFRRQPVVKTRRQVPQPPVHTAGPQDPVAIIGMAGRFPGSPDLPTFWQNLMAGRDLVSSDPERWTFDETERSDTSFDLSKLEAGFISDITCFDAEFFRISAGEADFIDPQQRLILEASWAAIETAGINPRDLRGTRTGVFVGSSTQDFMVRVSQFALDGSIELTPHSATGAASNNIPNRVSYALDLNGPSELVDTACSSSLVALNRAIQAIRSGECDHALVGGVNAILLPGIFAAFTKTGLLSREMRCRSFAKDANGYVRGEGVGAILLKPLAKAQVDGDPVLAVVRGTAVNHGGHVQSLTAPSPRRQAEVIRAAIADAQIEPTTIGYIEAHGTGTTLGDSVEVSGLRTAFDHALSDTQALEALPTRFCGLGSVKSNIGHLEAAAGIAGVIKTVLALNARMLPPSIHLDQINPYLNIDDSPFFLVQDATEWGAVKDESGAELSRIAGVSSFGFGGTNAHVVLEEAPQVAVAPPSPGLCLVPLSAMSDDRLASAAATLQRHLVAVRGTPKEPDLKALAFTLQVGRAAWPCRLAIVVKSLEDLSGALDAFLSERPDQRYVAGSIQISERLRKSLGGPTAKVLTQHLSATAPLDQIAQLWVEGVDLDWRALHGSDAPRRVSLPEFPLRRTVHWPVRVATADYDVPENPRTNRISAHVAGSTSFIQAEVARLLSADVEGIKVDQELTDYGFDSILAMQLIDAIEKHSGLKLFASELSGLATIADLAAVVDKELDARPSKPGAVRVDPTPRKDTSIEDPIFILSAPRSGSTLLRTVLMGHPQLFAPPELHLLSFEDLAARRSGLKTGDLDEGLTETWAKLRGIDAEAAVGELDELATQKTETKAIYRRLMEMASPQRLVDKSPTYGAQSETLESAQQMFPNARYIFIVRRPEPVLESFVSNRFHKLLGQETTDPWTVAETVWTHMNQTISTFLAKLPDHMHRTVHYEDLVLDPTRSVRALMDWLDLPFASEMLDPYGPDRMTSGLKSGSRSIGDPNFLDHKGIDAAESTTWLDNEDVPALSDRTCRLAGHLGYPVCLEKYAQPADWLLVQRFACSDRLQITDDQVHAALTKLMALHPQLGRKDSARALVQKLRVYAQPKVEALMVAAENSTASQMMDGAISGLAVVLTQPAQGKPSFLSLVIDHRLADGLSGLRLASDLLCLLTNQPVLPASPSEALESIQEKTADAAPLPDAWALASTASGTSSDLIDLELNLPSGPSDGADGSDVLIDRLTAALANVLATRSESESVVIALRHHGRTDPARSVDGRAVGNFAFDVPLELSRDASLQDAARRRSEMTRLMFARPFEDRKCTDKLTNVRLNYQPLFQLDAGDISARMIAAYEAATPSQGETNATPRLDLIIRQNGEGLTALARFRDGVFDPDDIHALANDWFVRAGLAKSCANKKMKENA